MITINDKKYKVLENLGYQGGRYGKVVKTEQGERIAVSATAWRWNIPIIIPYVKPTRLS